MPVDVVSEDFGPVVILASVEVVVENVDAQPVADIGALVGAVSAELSAAAELIVEAAARVGAAVETEAGIQINLGGTNELVKS